jgi:hypothetical protein
VPVPAFTSSSAFVNDDSRGLAPTTVLPSQFFGPRDAVLQPEKRLMLAVLENAVWLLLHDPPGHDGKDRRSVAEAAEWVAADATDWPFTFVNVCDALGLAPEWIRAGLRRRVGRAATARPGPSPTPHFPFRRLAATRQRVGTRHHS